MAQFRKIRAGLRSATFGDNNGLPYDPHELSHSALTEERMEEKFPQTHAAYAERR